MSTRRPLTVTWPWATNAASLRPALAEAQPMDDVVQPAFQQAHQRFAGVALAAFGLGEILAELPLQHAVVMLDLLLFAQVHAVVGQLAAAAVCMPGGDSRRSTAHLGVSQRDALEEQLHPLAAAQAADRSCMTSHNLRVAS